MKILVIHNHYLEKGGEDEVVGAEARLLEEHGHNVILYEKTNEDIQRLSPLRRFIFALLGINFSKSIYKEVREIVKREKPDIAHIHNIFFYLTPAVYFALKIEGVPIAQSLHNYRFFCIKGTFFRKGSICEKCKDGKFFNAIINRCWRNSFVLSLFLAKLLYKSKAFLNKIDAFIVTSRFSKNKFIELGLDEKKVFLKVNFLSDEPQGNNQDQNYALFLGRLVDYKGVVTLIKAFKIKGNFNLKIIGDGPLRKDLQNSAASANNIDWLGRVTRDVLVETLRNCSFVIFPSECYENMPMVIMESFAFSKPILASNLGAIKEFVVDGVNGVLFDPGDEKDLAAKAAYLSAHSNERAEMGKNANKFYKERFNKEKNYSELLSIYMNTLHLKRG